MGIRASIFCSVRETAAWPMCVFYSRRRRAVPPALRPRRRRATSANAARPEAATARWPSTIRERVRGGRRSRMMQSIRCAVRSLAVLLVLAAAPARRATGRRDDRPARHAGHAVRESRRPSRGCSGSARARRCCWRIISKRYGAATIPREDRVSAFERLQLPPAAALSHATVIKVGAVCRRVGRHRRLLRAGGRAPDGARARSFGSTPDACCPRSSSAGRWPICSASTSAPPAGCAMRRAPLPAIAAGTLLTSPQALELFVKGLVAETAATQRSFLEQALKLAPARRSRAGWRCGRCTAISAIISRRSTRSRRCPRPAAIRATARYLAALSQIDLKRYDEAFDTLKALASEARSAEVLNAIGVVQLRRGGTRANRQAGVLLQPGVADRPHRSRLLLQSRLRVLARPGSAGGGLLAARSRAPRSDRWRRALRARRGAAADGRHRRSGARAGAGAAPVVELRRLGQARGRRGRRGAARPGASEGSPRAAGRARRFDHHVDRAARSGGARDVSSRRRPARVRARSRSRGGAGAAPRAVSCRRIWPRRICCSDAIHLRGGRTSDAIQAFKIALWSEETVAGARGASPRRICSVAEPSPRARKRSIARWCSTRRPSRPGRFAAKLACQVSDSCRRRRCS